MSQSSYDHSATRPRRDRARLRLTALLAGLGIILGGFAWFAFANSERATGVGDGFVLTADSATSPGRWHWLDAQGNVGPEIDESSRIVPGDVLGHVAPDGTLTDTRFVKPIEAGNETQRQRFTLASGDTYSLVPAHPGIEIEIRHDATWMALAAGSAALLAASAVVAAASGRRKAHAAPAA